MYTENLTLNYIKDFMGKNESKRKQLNTINTKQEIQRLPTEENLKFR